MSSPARITLIFFGLFLGANSASGGPNYDMISKLQKDLLENYNDLVLPYVNQPVLLNMTMTPIHFDVDELSSRFSVANYFGLHWNDERLKWSPEDYGGIKDIRIPSDLIWIPDLALYNGDGGQDSLSLPKTMVVVEHTGSVTFVPPTTFTVPCKLDLTYWPYDVQRCILSIGSWTYHKQLIGFNSEVNTTQEVDLYELSIHGVWKMMEAVQILYINYYTCCPEGYPVTTFKFTIARKDFVLQHVLKLPAILVTLITLATFLLPVNSGNKLTVSVVNLLMISIFIIYLICIIPSANHFPIIVSIYGSIFILVGVSVATNIIVTTISQQNKCRAPPKFIQRLLNHRYVGRMLFMDTKRCKNPDDGTAEENAFQWFILATALDRIVFIIYMNIVCSLTFTLYTHSSSKSM